MPNIRVLFHYEAGPELRSQLKQLASQGLEITCYPQRVDEQFLTLLSQADVLWHVLEPITEAMLAAAPALRLIQKIGVGVNTIDLEAAKARGVAVCNMPGTNSQAVAEHTLMLMLATVKQLNKLQALCHNGQWEPMLDVKETLGELSGRTVGFVGFGEVPKRLAPVLALLGAEVVYTATQDKHNGYTFLPFEKLLAGSDVVSLHLPLSDSTQGLIDGRAIDCMRQGAVLINTARGGLVCEKALLAGLQSGKISAAGLDVFAQEPVDKSNPLLQLDNVVVTPHVAWLTRETLQRSVDVAVWNTLAAMDDTPLKYKVL